MMNRFESQANFIFSPLSIYSGLSLALAGAANESKVELVKALRIKESPDHNALCKSVSKDLQSFNDGDTNKTLVQANASFLQTGGKILETYLQIVQKDFEAMLKEIDFSKSEEARKIINEWVEEVTKSKIKELLPAGSLNDNVHLVLVNAIYFKGSWQTKFDKNSTHEGNFITLNGVNMKAKMMNKKNRYKVASFSDIGARAIKIPFECHEMLILLPDADDGLPNVIKKINENPNHFVEILTSSQYANREILLKMPKFYLEGQSIKLNDELRKMGLKSIFCGDADFSRITGDRSLYVSGVYHQAMIEVDEEGAEAAAATGIVMTKRMMRPMTPEFNIDHPFMFFITTNSGLPIFMGHILEPKEK